MPFSYPLPNTPPSSFIFLSLYGRVLDISYEWNPVAIFGGPSFARFLNWVMCPQVLYQIYDLQIFSLIPWVVFLVS